MIAPLPAIAAHPDRIKRQDVVVLTQTIVTPDSTRTAIITLGNGGHTDAGPAATGAPNPPLLQGPHRHYPGLLHRRTRAATHSMVLSLARPVYPREDRKRRGYAQLAQLVLHLPPTDQGSDDGLQPMDPALPDGGGGPRGDRSRRQSCPFTTHGTQVDSGGRACRRGRPKDRDEGSRRRESGGAHWSPSSRWVLLKR
ncbi:hypothetical protein PG999_007761 [Apiospora kogelbergensis]|uniref:Uncharacterized protein n=1 Tax=Apiospora kogelbergensis TaxID=1337665 RepID=A0AAW0QN69_9PEZI